MASAVSLRRLRRALGFGSPRASLARALDSVGLLDRLLWMRARFRFPLLTVFTYHRVAEPQEVGDLDQGVAESSVPELEEHIAVIKEHCTVVSMSDVLRFCTEGARLPPNPVMISFDDGYTDNYTTALPILERAGIPATFFIPTAYPEGGRLFWWDRVALLIHRCRRPRVELEYPARLVLTPASAPEAAIKLLCRIIKRVPGVDLGRTWEELERATGVSLATEEERRFAAANIMSWSQVRGLRRAGMDVQSHSHSHRVLDTLSPEDAARDLARSRRILSEVLGEQVRTVAYPVGYCLDGAFRSAVEGAGFDLGFTNDTGVCITSRFDRLNVPRVAMDRCQVGALYKLKLLVGERSASHARA